MKEQNDSGWIVKSLKYKGFPLFLRYPKQINIELISKLFPFLFVVEHDLEKVRADGTPETNYNLSLNQFDDEVINFFDPKTQGVSILVETFGGKRNYYIYVINKDVAKKCKQNITDKYPNLKLKFFCHEDGNCEFFEKYNNEFGLS